MDPILEAAVLCRLVIPEAANPDDRRSNFVINQISISQKKIQYGVTESYEQIDISPL